MTDWPFSGWDDAEVWDDNAEWSEGALSLLPAGNSGLAELAIERTSARIEAFPDRIRPLWNSETIPAGILPWLAWALSVDEWAALWTEEQKRDVVAASIDVHRRKGTVGSIRRALIAAGLGDAELIERFGRKFYDGSIAHDGSSPHDEPDHWAEYRVVLMRPLSIAQAQQARRIIEATAPLRCHLKVMDFTAVSILENGEILHDGTYSHGAA